MRANYEVLDSDKNKVIIRDNGGDGYATVTNAAEWVVEELFINGVLKQGQRLFYWDSDGNLDELLIVNGHFDGFRPHKVAPIDNYHTKEPSK